MGAKHKNTKAAQVRRTAGYMDWSRFLRREEQFYRKRPGDALGRALLGPG